MLTHTPAQQAMLGQYLATLTTDEIQQIPNLYSIPAEHFCNDEYNANECARLVNIGKKTASCGLKAGWEVDNEPLPKVGSLTIVTNWQAEPVCITKLNSVKVARFDEVTAEFAKAEGEADGSYTWWRQAHFDFFTEYAASIGVTFATNSELVLERFVKVYPAPMA